MKFLGAGFTAEVPGDAINLLGDALLAHLVTVVTGDALQTQASSETLLEQQLATFGVRKRKEGGRETGHLIKTCCEAYTHTLSECWHDIKGRQATTLRRPSY